MNIYHGMAVLLWCRVLCSNFFRILSKLWCFLC